MSKNWAPSFVRRVTEFIEESETIKNSLAEPLKKQLEQTLKWLLQALEPLNSQKWKIEWEIDNKLNTLLERLFDDRRIKVISILSSWEMQYSIKDLEYIRKVLRLWDNFPIEILDRIITWSFTKDDIPVIIIKISQIDKDSCRSFFMKKLGIENINIDSLVRCYQPHEKIKKEDILDIIRSLWYVTNKKTLDYIVEEIIFKNSHLLSKDELMILLWDSRLKDLFLNSAKIEFNELEIFIKKLIETWNTKEILYVLWCVREKAIKFIIEIILNDNTIDHRNIAIIVRALWSKYKWLFWLLLKIPRECILEIDKVFLAEERKSLSFRYKIIRNISDKRGKYVMFWVLLNWFDLKMFKALINEILKEKSEQLKKEQSNTEKYNEEIRKTKEQISEEIKDILSIPNLPLDEETLGVYEPTWKESGIFKSMLASMWLSKLFSSGKDKVKSPFSDRIKWFLAYFWIKSSDAENLSNKSNSLLFKDVVQAIVNTKTFEWRKMIFDNYFREKKWFDVEYSQVLDILFQKDCIKKLGLFKNWLFLNLVNDFWENENAIKNVDYITDHFKHRLELLSTPFILKAITDFPHEEFKSIIDDIDIAKMDDWTIDSLYEYDLSTITLLLKEIKWLKLSNIVWAEWNISRLLKQFLTIGVDTKLAKRRRNLISVLRLYGSKMKPNDIKRWEFHRVLDNFDNDVMLFLEEHITSWDEAHKNKAVKRFLDLVKEVFTKSSKSDKKVNRLKEYEEVCRAFRINLDFEWLLKNSKNELFCTAHTTNNLILAINRYVLNGVFWRDNWNVEYKELIKKWKIKWLSSPDFSIECYITLNSSDLESIWLNYRWIILSDESQLWEIIWKVYDKS